MLLLVLVVAALYSSSVQTALAKYVVEKYLNDENVTISFDKVNIHPFHSVFIDNLLVTVDQDTLIYTRQIAAEIKYFSAISQSVLLKETNIYKGKFYLFQDENRELNINKFTRLFASDKKTKNTNWEFDLGKINLSDINFKYKTYNAAANDTINQIKYNNINVRHINGAVVQTNFDSSKVVFNVKNFSLAEKSGFKIEDLNTLLTISNGNLLFDSLQLQTEHSYIGGSFYMQANSFKNYAHFNDSVKINFQSDSSVLQLDEIKYFASNSPFYNEHVVLQGQIKGYVNRFKSKNIYANFSSGTTIYGDLDVSDITHPQRTFLFLKVKKLYTSKQAVSTLASHLNQQINLPGNLDKLGLLTYSGTLTGFYSDFVLYGNLITALGELKTDISVKTDNDVSYSGKIGTNRFNFGRLLGLKNDLKQVALNAEINGTGTTVETINAAIKGNIYRLDFRDYVYENFDVNGVLSNGYFQGNFSINDTNLQLAFNGLIDIKSATPYFNFETKIKKADLVAIHLLKDTLYHPIVSVQSYVSLSLKNDDFAHGNIELNNLSIQDETGKYQIPKIEIISLAEENNKNIQIQSSVIKGGMSGNYNLSTIGYQLMNHLQKYNSAFAKKEDIEPLNNLNIQLDFSLDTFLTKYFVRERLGVAKGKLLGEFRNGNGNFIFNADEVVYKQYNAKSINISIAADSSLKVLTTINQFMLKDSVLLQEFDLTAGLKNDSISFHSKWNKKTGEPSADIRVEAFYHDNIFEAQFLPSFYYIDKYQWQTNEQNKLTYDLSDSVIIIKNLKLFNKDANQNLLVDGEISNKPDKTLDILIQDFDFSILNYFVNKKILETQGLVNGTFSMRNILKSPIVDGHLTVDDLSVNTIYLGKATLHSKWKNFEKKLSLNGEIKYGAIPSIQLSGNYLPFDQQNNFDFAVTMHQTDVKLFAPYIENVLSEIQGNVTGNMFLKGTAKKPLFTGQLSLSHPKFKVNYLNTYFSAPSIPFYLYDDFIAADNIKLFDQQNNPLYVNVSLAHKNLTNLNYDISGITEKAFVLNTTEIQNDLFYGQAYVGGQFDVSGDSKTLFVDLDIKTLKGTSLNIPVDQTESLEAFEFIEFATADTLSEKDTLTETELDVHLSMLADITPETEIKIIFDKQLGDVIRSKGKGNLKITYANEEFKIFGDYTIINGDYLFTLQNVINKKFDITSGSTIHWSGDVYEGELNIDASYKLRTRLYDLLAAYDSTDFYKRRIPVEVKLKMTNTLSAPYINFAIDLPTADQTTKDLVNSVLLINGSSSNNQELNKQVFALLVLHRFLPPPGSTNSYAHSSFVSTSSSELLSNQLSNWLSQLSSDFDIGFNYRPGDELSSQEVNLALSTQIFNDRLIIDGNVGYASNKYNPSGTSALIGDINIEYKISKDGNFRVKAFNKTNANNYYFNNSPYTQGVGVYYQEEFNTTREFFNKFFNRFKRKNSKKKDD